MTLNAYCKHVNFSFGRIDDTYYEIHTEETHYLHFNSVIIVLIKEYHFYLLVFYKENATNCTVSTSRFFSGQRNPRTDSTVQSQTTRNCSLYETPYTVHSTVG
jgi:hypothetical protein